MEWLVFACLYWFLLILIDFCSQSDNLKMQLLGFYLSNWPNSKLVLYWQTPGNHGLELILGMDWIVLMHLNCNSELLLWIFVVPHWSTRNCDCSGSGLVWFTPRKACSVLADNRQTLFKANLGCRVQCFNLLWCFYGLMLFPTSQLENPIFQLQVSPIFEVLQWIPNFSKSIIMSYRLALFILRDNWP